MAKWKKRMGGKDAFTLKTKDGSKVEVFKYENGWDWSIQLPGNNKTEEDAKKECLLIADKLGVKQ